MTFEEKVNKNIYPNKQTLNDLYIRQNLSREETCRQLNLTIRVFTKLTKYYGIKKDYSSRIENRIKTNLKIYGVEDSSTLPCFVEKRKETCLRKFGKTTNLGTSETSKKIKRTSLAKYGVEAPSQSVTVQSKIRATMKERYGVENYKERRLPLMTRKVLSSKKNFIAYIKTFTGKPSLPELAQSLTCSISLIQKKVQKWKLGRRVDINPNTSRYEKEISELLWSWKICTVSNTRDVLPSHKEIDIYCPEQHIGIEFNGNYWHSSLHKDKKYHLEKSIEAMESGIRLIHIYEFEWQDSVVKEKIISLLRIAFGEVLTHIYARQCDIKEITNKEASVLNNKVHLQGHRNAQVTYGLFYKGELVQLMSFSKTKYNRNLKSDNEWEIIRGCPGSNNIVVGGVSKLFSHFVRDYNPDSIFSYCDFNKFDGKSYEAIGMKFIGYTGPDKTWYINGGGVRRNPSRYKELKEQADGIIWGSGSKKYLWKK